MPILPCEPSIFPDDLLERDSTCTEMQWRVLHVKPRQEKSLARDLIAREIGFYLPTVRRITRSSGRVRTSEVPLFDGYLFLCSDRDQYVTALSTSRVVRALDVQDQGRVRFDLRQLKRLLDLETDVFREERLVPGLPVEIVDGPLCGVRGTIVRAANGPRFVVSVDFIRQGASVTIDASLLRPLGRGD